MKTLAALASFWLCATSSQAQVRTYDASVADQFLEALAEDIVPEDPMARATYLEHRAFDAAIFGRVAVLTYIQMHAQAIDRSSEQFVGFNRFAHGRDLAGPGYKPFKTPNADTLYSNAYLDLSEGPVLLTVPPTDGRYYTVNFLDLFGNATNISARSHGTDGGRYLIATTDWEGEVPEGVTLFRVTQPYMWILMRIEAEDPSVVPQVRSLQDRFQIVGPNEERDPGFYPPPAHIDAPTKFLQVLDWIVQHAGVRQSELGAVAQFRALGIGGERQVSDVMADEVSARAIATGFAEAEDVLKRSIAQNGVRIGGGWREPLDIGRYGYNYLYRSSVNSLGTGANVRLENFAFTTFEDAEGDPLDGSQHIYVLHFDTPPPSDFFWSVTVYDRATQELVPNRRGKYLVSDNTQGLRLNPDGSVTIELSKNAEGPNAIPIPDGPFYLALRAQGPRKPLLDAGWRPQPVRKEQNAK